MNKNQQDEEKSAIEKEIQEDKILEKKEVEFLEENMKQNEEDELHSIKTPDTNDGKYIKIGMLVLFIVFVIIGTWSATAKLDTGVPCPGQVIVESNKKTIQSLEGGTIKKIYVKDGDKIAKDGKLILFDTTKSQSELDSLLANYYEAVALRDRLQAESSGKDMIEFSKELDKQSLHKKEEIKTRQKNTFKHETQYIKKQAISINQKIKLLKKRIESTKESIQKQHSLLESYKTEVLEQDDLVSQGLVDKTKLVDAKRKITSIENDILHNQAEIEKSYIDIESAKNDLNLNKEKFFADVNTKLSKEQASVADMHARMINLKNRLSQTVLKSPVNGVVMNLMYHTIGAVVAPGKPIMDVVPENANLVIEASLSPQFVEYVKIGEKARLSFPAFAMDSQFIENVEGEVIFISPDTTTDDRKQTFYTIKLKVTPKGKEVLEKSNLMLLAGMPASAIVIAGSQTALEYLFKPLSKMLEKAFLEK